MKKKYNIEYIKQKLNDRGYTLLSKVYKSCKDPLYYKCIKGHEGLVNFDYFLHGWKGCKICRTKTANSRILSLKIVKDAFQKRGFTLLLEDYTGNTQKLNYECPKGHMGTTCYSSFQQGYGCKQCANELSRTVRQHSFNDVKNMFMNKGCLLLSTKYINNSQKLEYLCKCGRLCKATLQHFKDSDPCPNCNSDCRKDETFVIELLGHFGFELVPDTYKSVKQPLEFLCPCGAKTFRTLQKFYICNRCGVCKKTYKTKLYPWIDIGFSLYIEKVKFTNLCRGLVSRCLKESKPKSELEIFNILGYSYKELRNHIFIHPSWNVIRDTQWSIDHIFPVAAFIKNNIYDIKLINSLENLQPMSLKENCQKSDKYNILEFKSWLSSKGVII